MKTRIAVKPENEVKIQKALDEVQGRARTRTVDASYVIGEAKREIKFLSQSYGVSKKHMAGLVVRYSPWAGNFPGSYFGTPMATYFVLSFTSAGTATLIECGRDKAYKDSYNRDRHVVSFPDELKERILSTFLNRSN